MTRWIKDVSYVEAMDCFKDAVIRAGMANDDLPEKYIKLASYASRVLLEKICEKNDLEVYPDADETGDSQERSNVGDGDGH